MYIRVRDCRWCKNTSILVAKKETRRADHTDVLSTARGEGRCGQTAVWFQNRGAVRLWAAPRGVERLKPQKLIDYRECAKVRTPVLAFF